MIPWVDFCSSKNNNLQVATFQTRLSWDEFKQGRNIWGKMQECYRRKNFEMRNGQENLGGRRPPKIFTRKFDEAEGHQAVTKESLGDRRPSKFFFTRKFQETEGRQTVTKENLGGRRKPKIFQKKIRGGRKENLTRPEAKIRHKKFSIII